MPIGEESPPAEAVGLARSALGTALLAQFSGASLNAAAAPPELGTAYRVFVAGLSDVIERRLIAGAKPVGWQFLVTAATEPVAAIEVPGDATLQESRQFNHVGRGPHVASTHAAVRRVGDRPDVINGSLRILRIPALYTVCVWLHGDNVDEFIPIAPTPEAVGADEVLSESELTKRLMVVALQRENASAAADVIHGEVPRQDRPKAP